MCAKVIQPSDFSVLKNFRTKIHFWKSPNEGNAANDSLTQGTMHRAVKSFLNNWMTVL